jgi:hypothetical protein
MTIIRIHTNKKRRKRLLNIDVSATAAFLVNRFEFPLFKGARGSTR